jgi:hypothetical protein
MAYISLLIQNILILAHISIAFLLIDVLNQIGFPLPLFEITYYLIFHLDLLGFFLLAVSSIGYAVTSLTESKRKHHLIGGFCVFCWVVCRGLNQYGFLLPNLVFNEKMTDFMTFVEQLTPSVEWTPTPSAVMIVLYILASIFLALASIFIGVHDEITNRPFILYALANLVAVFLQTFLAFGGYYMLLGGLMMKGSLIPVLGIIASISMLVALIGTPHWAMEEEFRSCLHCGEKLLQKIGTCPYCLK